MAKKSKSTKKPKPYRSSSRYGILNPFGDLWSPETFSTPAEAERYVARFWHGTREHTDLKKFKAVPVRVTVSIRP